MEIRIGVHNVSREIVIESDASADEVKQAVAEAIENAAALLSLTDKREKTILVPVSSIGYVEIGSNAKHTVGFAAAAD